MDTINIAGASQTDDDKAISTFEDAIRLTPDAYRSDLDI